MTMRRAPISIAVFLTIIAAACVRVSAATWVSPMKPQPGGNAAPSLNTSSSPQTKHGGISVNGSVTAEAGSAYALTLGASSTERGLFCLKGVCMSGWDDFAALTGKLVLSPSAQSVGVVDMLAIGESFAEPNDVNATVRGVAGNPTGNPTSMLSTAGVYGEASSSQGKSYGIYAKNLVGTSGNAAIFADTYIGQNPYGGWAGYFNGSAIISNAKGGICENKPASWACSSDLDCASDGSLRCVPFPSLFIGSAALPPQDKPKNVGYLCLGSDANDPDRCRSTWPAVNGSDHSIWQCPDCPGKLLPVDLLRDRSVAMAGSGKSAGMSVQIKKDQVGTLTGADVNVRGTATFTGQYAVGTPSGVPVSMTCGDGQCTGLENDAFGSQYYCQTDCDVTPPANVIYHSSGTLACGHNWCRIEEPGEVECHPLQQYRVFFWWENPMNPDYAGVTVVIRQDRMPNGHDDSSQGNVSGGDYPPGVVSFMREGCTANTAYYVGLYAYDSNNNGRYAPGVQATARCENYAVGHDAEYCKLKGG